MPPYLFMMTANDKLVGVDTYQFIRRKQLARYMTAQRPTPPDQNSTTSCQSKSITAVNVSQNNVARQLLDCAVKHDWAHHTSV